MSYRSGWRKLVNAVMFTVTGMCAIAAVSVLFWILGYLVWNGGKALDLDFFVKLPKPPGEAGGGMESQTRAPDRVGHDSLAAAGRCL